jgi:Fur family peroxide stress response transcriptional regulator
MDARNILAENGIRPTLQRLQIYKYLAEKKNHPTVEHIYSDLLPHIPTLSKTTLYNTLNLFIDKGITAQITIENDETRYDANLCSHGHFKCRKCGNIIDFPHDIDLERSELPSDSTPEQAHLYVWGICGNCKD